jgi:hypothetical protein
VRAPALWLACLLALLPLCAEAMGVYAPRGASRALFALLPWLALAGLPRGARAAQSPELPALLLLPALAAAWAADRRAPGAGGALAPALAGLGAVLLLGAAAARGGALYAVLWTLLVPLPAALLSAFHLSGASGALGGPRGLAGALGATPLAWAVGRLDAHGARASDLAPLCAAALLALVARAEEGRRRAAAVEP